MIPRDEITVNNLECIQDGIEYELGVPIPGKILPPELWAKTAIKRFPEQGPLDIEGIFDLDAVSTRPRLVVDIGCGNGRFIISSAVRRSDVLHLGIDVLPVVIRYAARRANQRGLGNVRFGVNSGNDLLRRFFASQSIDELHIYHPQPFHHFADRHLRLLKPEFIVLAHDRLVNGGTLTLQSDNQPYWEYLRELISKVFRWEEITEPWSDDIHGRSRREMIAKEQQLPIFRAICHRREDLATTDVETLLASHEPPMFEASERKNPRSRRSSRNRPRRPKNN